MNAINWFEIPAANLERAVKFYEQILAAPLPIDASFPGMRMAMLPYAEPGIGGCLLEFEQARPHADGVRVYLNGGNDLQPILDRVVAAGGRRPDHHAEDADPRRHRLHRHVLRQRGQHHRPSLDALIAAGGAGPGSARQ